MGPLRTTIALLALAAFGPVVPASAQDAVPGYPPMSYDTDGQSVDSIAVFFEPLSHYGRWLDGRYGREWAPNVPRGWRPYTIGHWEEGAYGQTWRSDEPFGWAVFHFGRWAFDPPVGWVWLPDTVWGPGWVAWRDGDTVTGWAPLPPQVDAFYPGGYAVNDWGYEQWYQPAWVYVPRGYLYSRSLRGVFLPSDRGRDYWDRTRGVTRYDRVDGQIVNHSFGDGHRDVRGTPAAPAVRGTTPPAAFDGDGRGYPPPVRGYGGGFVPGTPVPRGLERRSVPGARGTPMPLAVPPRPAMPAPSAAPRPSPAPARPHDSRPADRPR